MKPWVLMSTASVVMFFGTIAVIPLVVAWLPERYFLEDEPRTDDWRTQHPVLRGALFLAKNLLGLLLLVAGLIMLVTPGQGLLTILLGAMLLDGPGKRTVVRHIASKPAIRSSLNWMRAKAGKAPLLFAPPESPDRAEAAPEAIPDDAPEEKPGELSGAADADKDQAPAGGLA